MFVCLPFWNAKGELTLIGLSIRIAPLKSMVSFQSRDSVCCEAIMTGYRPLVCFVRTSLTWDQTVKALRRSIFFYFQWGPRAPFSSFARTSVVILFMKTACKGASKMKKRGTKMLKRPRLVNNTMAEMIHQHTGCVAIGSSIFLCCTHFFVSAVVILHTPRLKFIFHAPWKEDYFCCIFAHSVETERQWNLGIIIAMRARVCFCQTTICFL